MALYKSEAIVLHSRKQGETSKLLSLYSRNFGLVKVVAKGSRSLKSHYWGVLELFNHIDMVYYHKEAREVQFLSQASIITTFKTLRTDIKKLAVAAALCELIEAAEIHGSANPGLFKLLQEFLTILDQRNTGWWNLLRGSMLKYLDISGFRPEFDYCESCHTDRINGNNYFVFKNGGYQCGTCMKVTPPGLVLAGDAIKLLRWLQKTELAQQATVRVPQLVGHQVDHFIFGFLAYHLEGGGHLRSLKFLHKTQPGLKNAPRFQAHGNENDN